VVAVGPACLLRAQATMQLTRGIAKARWTPLQCLAPPFAAW